jgi:hypothetical protein
LEEIEKRLHPNRKSMDLMNESGSRSPFSSKTTRGERYIDQRIRTHLKNNRQSREKYKFKK